MNSKRILGALIFLSFASLGILRAQKTVTGIVTDGDSGETLIGVNISIKGTADGTVTDYDGSYALEVTAEDTLVFSYIGYQEREVPVGNQSTIDVQMRSGELLEEIVVIGYGEVEKKDLTGAVQQVSSKDFNKGVVTSAQQMLAGKVAGVSVTTGSDPGGGATIRIRGESSLSANNDPLFVVDNVPYDFGVTGGSRNPLNIIPPSEIESITVLKDASATAIYGNRASGGVVLITTKTGRIGEGWRVSYSGKAAVSEPIGRVDVLGANEFRALVEDQFGTESDQYALLGDANTDWQDEIYREAFGHEHNVSMSGGFGMVPIRMSLGFSDYDGVLKTENFKRYNASINVNPRLLNNTLQINAGLKLMRNDNSFANRGAIGAATSFDPTQPIRDPNTGDFFAWLNNNGQTVGLSDPNPLALLNQTSDETTVDRYVANFSADYRFLFLPALRANLNLAYDRANGSGMSFTDPEAAFTETGFRSEFETTRQNRLLEFYLNYKEDLTSNLRLDVMGGYSYQKFEDENFSTSREIIGEVDPEIINDASDLVLVGLFGRANVTFNDKLYLTASLRRDGTSRFSEENRWGLFPAAAVAYTLIENDKSYLNRVKLRASVGVTGQENIGNRYAYLGTYTTSQATAQYQLGNQFVRTQRPNGFDENIRWEETTTYNAGVDFSLVKDRLSGSLDIYQRDTDDLLNSINAPAGTNTTNIITTNIGSMTNRGVELALFATPISQGDFQWDVSANVAYNENEITKLTAVDDPDFEGVLTGGIAGGVGSNIQINSVGFPVRSYFVRKQVFDEQGNIIPGSFEDLNGDGEFNSDDMYRFENPFADVSAGITSNISYKNFDFSFAGRANFGNYNYNNIKTDAGFLGRINRLSGALSNIHRSGVINNVQDQSQVTFSDFFVEEASFFRMDHITLGYTLQDKLFRSMRIYTTVQNPFVITNYEGLDPEIFDGIDNNLYPRSRNFVLGLAIDFN